MNEVSTSPEKLKILIIDDERFNLNTLNGLLKDEYKIMVATNGEQGLKAAITGLPDLILLDISMPGMDGYEVCARLKNDPLTGSIPIIFITAHTDASDETKGFELGAADYIAKPFNLAVVQARIRNQIKPRNNFSGEELKIEIEIDQKKREEEVKTLTGSSFFQEIKQEIAGVDLDKFWQ
jgi:putative two-component system response regulator